MDSLLGCRAREQLEHNLAERLAFIGARCLLQMWEPGRAEGQTYRQFVSGQLDSGLEELARVYPVAWRLMGKVVDHWCRAGREMLERLESDRARLWETFRWGASDDSVPLVESVSRALGDVHNGGRHVVSLRDRSGRWIVYKPRPMTQEAAYGRLLGWANDAGFSLPLLVPGVVDRGGYGWMEYLEADTDADAGGRARFWHRAGGHLALLRRIGATDLHVENLLAVGDQPVIVDLECMVQPLPHPALLPYEGETGRILVDSVLFTGLLPGALPARAGLMVDLSGFGGAPSQVTGTLIPRWRDIGTDRMHLGEMMAETPPSTNRPRGGTGPDIERLIRGYEEMDRLLVDGDPPLDEFSDLTTRVVFRATAIYSRVVKSIVQPDVLADERLFAAGLDELDEWLDRLEDLTDDSEDLDWARAVVDREKEAVGNLEIPWFGVDAGDGTLRTAEADLGPGRFPRNGAEGLRDRSRAAGAADRVFQTDLIAITLEGKEPRSRGEELREREQPDRPGEDPLSRAVSIGEWLAERALTSPGGGVWWLESRTRGYTAVRVPSLMDRSLYSGSAGVAVFLAALERVSGAPGRWTPLVRGALTVGPEADGAEGLVRWELTGGVSGRAYAAAVAGQLLGHEDLLAMAMDLMGSFEVPEISPVDPLDVVGGWSGVLLALCAVARRSGNEVMTERIGGLARAIGAEISTRLPPEMPQGHRRVGFAHGATGISLALGRASEITGDRSLLDVVADLVGTENAKVGARGGPPGRRGPTGGAVERAWCWGSGGFALVRSRLAPLVGDPARDHLDAACTHTASGPSGNDRLCCGVPGQLDAMVEAGVDREFIRPLVSRLLVRSEDLVLEPGLSFRGRSLFRGMAGVGYALLRSLETTEARQLPCVLLFD